VHVTFPSHFTPERLKVALSHVPLAGVTLPNTASVLSTPPTVFVSALAGSAATLTALHGLPLVRLQCSVGEALPRLRALTLRHRHLDTPLVLDAKLLPAELEQLTLTFSGVLDPYYYESTPALVSSLDRLQSLRQIIFAGAYIWPHRRWEWDRVEAPLDRLQVPRGVEVCTVVHVRALQVMAARSRGAFTPPCMLKLVAARLILPAEPSNTDSAI